MDEMRTETSAGRDGGNFPAAADGGRGNEQLRVDRGVPRTTVRLALGLGLLGVGLGLAELLAPRRLNHLIGIGDRPRGRALTRLFGMRELVSGLGLLGRRRPAPWLWARVAGDALDLALLGGAARRKDAKDVRIGRLAGVIATVVGVTALDLYAATKAKGRVRTEVVGPVRQAITIAVTPERAYAFWRELGNLPAFMERLVSVEQLDTRRSRWQARSPLGGTVSWEAQIIEERPNELIRWHSVAGSEMATHGEVRFRTAPGGRGAELAVEISYVPPAGELGRAAAFFSNKALSVQLERDLRRLKQLLELGEVVHSDASIHRGRHPARPAVRGRS